MPQAQYYPDWFDPDEHWLAQGQKHAPAMTLIEGKLFATQKVRTDIDSPDDIVGRGGVTAVRNTDATPSKQLNWIYNQVFNSSNAGSAANLTNQMVDNAADAIALTKDFVDEMAEGLYGMSYTDPKYLRFWQRVKARCAAATPPIPYKHFHTYGTFASIQGDPWEFMSGDGSPKPPNHAIFKALLQSQTAARKKPNGDPQDFFALFFAMGMGNNVKHYADKPDYASRYYNKAYAAEVLNLAFGAVRGIPSLLLIYIDWMNIEGLGDENGDLHNGFFFERQVGTLGKVRYQEHPKVDFDWQIGCIFCIGFVRMGGYALFDVPNQFGTDPTKIDSRVDFQWIPAVTGTPAPTANPGYPVEPKRGHDAGFIAAFLYNQCYRTEGEPWQYCEYKVVGTDTWITPASDNTTILEHASANDGAFSATGRRGRADAMYRIKGNAVDVWVFDPSRPKWSRENLILRPVPGLEIPVTVSGCKVLLRNETI